ncbi:MAG: hypothetical protein U1E56_11265 [Bauldia sp.]
MYKAIIAAAALALGLASAPSAANAQNYMGTPTSVQNYRFAPLPRPAVLTPAQITRSLYAQGWWNVRYLDRHVWYYTARASSWRGTYNLVINGFNGRVISARWVDLRRR